MRRETLSSLADIIRAADLIREALVNVNLETYQANWEKQSAIERQLLVIGEAMVRIRGLDPDLFERIPDASNIVRLRNLLAHGYDAVDANAIFALCIEPLAQLREAVSTLTEL